MAVMMTRIRVEDYDAWKVRFDSDPPGARAAATRHHLFRTASDPNEVSIAVEFPSVAEAETARARLLESGVLGQVTLQVPPTVVELAEERAY
jgi:hypothetical protein